MSVLKKRGFFGVVADPQDFLWINNYPAEEGSSLRITS